MTRPRLHTSPEDAPEVSRVAAYAHRLRDEAATVERRGQVPLALCLRSIADDLDAIETAERDKMLTLREAAKEWVHLLLEAGATVRNLKDVKWCATEDGLPGKGTGRHIAAFVLEPKDPR